MTSPMYSSGVTTSTANTGSSSIGPALRIASLNAIEPAILNAISEESTSWKQPSTSVTLMSTTGKPASTPDSIASWMPWSTGPMYSFGIEPPTILFDELVAGARLVRLEVDDHVAELAAAAGLADEPRADVLQPCGARSRGRRPAACRRWRRP